MTSEARSGAALHLLLAVLDLWLPLDTGPKSNSPDLIYKSFSRAQ